MSGNRAIFGWWLSLGAGLGVIGCGALSGTWWSAGAAVFGGLYAFGICSMRRGGLRE